MRALLAGLPLLVLLVLPLLALLAGSADLALGVRHPSFLPALWLSVRTSIVALGLIVLLGTPLSWWLANAPRQQARWVEGLVDLPIVMPPAVVGLGLLIALGRSGPLGALGIQLPFTTWAVVTAQVVIASPFFVSSATAAFRRVDPELMLVARTLGETPWGAFRRVALPLAMPGIAGGLALAWARALGEFGATLLFAGNLPGVTQTMPLAVYSTLERDVQAAVSLALVLAAVSVGLLLALRQLGQR